MPDTTELRRLLSEASALPWGMRHHLSLGGGWSPDDCVLAVAAVNILPHHLNTLDLARVAVEEWRAWLSAEKRLGPYGTMTDAMKALEAALAAPATTEKEPG